MLDIRLPLIIKRTSSKLACVWLICSSWMWGNFNPCICVCVAVTAKQLFCELTWPSTHARWRQARQRPRAPRKSKKYDSHWAQLVFTRACHRLKVPFHAVLSCSTSIKEPSLQKNHTMRMCLLLLTFAFKQQCWVSACSWTYCGKNSNS